MYTITCDGFPILNLRDPDYVVVSPRLKLEVNTVGEGSFTIYKTHPNYDKIVRMKSVFVVSEDDAVIFRGRAIGETVDIEQGKAIELEGAMAFFNDTLVRPFSFPEDFQDDEAYIAAFATGNVVEFFLSWLIDQHNAQVQDFQKLILGNVTVSDPNNYITRSNSNYATTWETLKSKLFDSELGGYLCARYTEEATYIDYYSEFIGTNPQEIAHGENILSLRNETQSVATYSACVPIGKDGLTISGLEDGYDGASGLEKKGDMLISEQGVADYGFVCAPPSETTWEDVTDPLNLLVKAGDWLKCQGILPTNTVEITAVDLHFTDAEISSLRIDRYVKVRSELHGLEMLCPVTSLEIDMMSPQNTKITIGSTARGLTDRTKTEYATLAQKVDANTSALHYVAIAITSLTNNVGTVELGSVVNAVTISWGVNKTPASQTLNGEAVSGTSVSYTERITADKTYTLKVTDTKGATDTATTSIRFCNGVYYGVIANGATINSAALLNLSKELRGDRKKTFTANAGSTQKLCFACPTRYGTPVFTIGGFDYEWDKTTIQFTNASGYTESYDVWTSPQTGLGYTTVAVS